MSAIEDLIRFQERGPSAVKTPKQKPQRTSERLPEAPHLSGDFSLFAVLKKRASNSRDSSSKVNRAALQFMEGINAADRKRIEERDVFLKKQTANRPRWKN